MSNSDMELTFFSLSRTDLHGLNSLHRISWSCATSLQKYQHAKTTAFYGIDFGEVKHDGSGVSLRGDSFA
jgi:hypothetical protein